MNDGSSGLVFLSVLVVLAALLYGFYETGGPAEQRRIRSDAVRIQHLQQIEDAMKSYERSRHSLPDSLDTLRHGPIDVYLDGDYIADPITFQTFEYLPQAGTQYQLCANFDTNTLNPDQRLHYSSDDEDYGRYARYYDDNPRWHHPKGHACFTRNAADKKDEKPN